MSALKFKAAPADYAPIADFSEVPARLAPYAGAIGTGKFGNVPAEIWRDLLRVSPMSAMMVPAVVRARLDEIDEAIAWESLGDAGASFVAAVVGNVAVTTPAATTDEKGKTRQPTPYRLVEKSFDNGARLVVKLYAPKAAATPAAK